MENISNFNEYLLRFVSINKIIANLKTAKFIKHQLSGSDGTEQGIRAGQNIRTEHQKYLVVRTEHWSEHQNILNNILIKLFIF